MSLGTQIIVGIAFVLAAALLGVALAFWANSRFPDDNPQDRFPD